MEIASTPASRREAWRPDALRLVEEFQAHARGAVRESFPPWRIGYMWGLSSIVETPDAFKAMAHRVEPRERNHPVEIPKRGRPSARLVDDLCWHLEQDVRLMGREDHYDDTELWNRLPAGPVLVDALFATIMADLGLAEATLMNRIREAEGFGQRRSVRVWIGRPLTGQSLVTVERNEVHARLELPWGPGATWSRGHLTLPLGEMPDTALLAARGKPLAQVIDHELIRRSAPITVTAITRIADGRHVIATDAADPERMQPVMTAPQRIAA